MQTTTKKHPMFTIVTVCYNSVLTIEQTIHSVLAQTFSDYEYWIIDGGSTDGTLDIVNSYQKKFKGKLFVISEPDTGIYNAMNKGIKQANGIIIGLLNSDDWLEPDTLAIIATSVSNEKDGAKSIFCGWVRFYYSDGRVNILKTNDKRHMRCHKNIEIGVRHPATFVGHDVYNTVGFFDENFKIMADADFIFRCTEAHIPFVFINNILTNMSDGGISNRKKYMSLNISEIKLLCRKHSKNQTKYFFLVTRKLIKLYCKAIVPQCILRFYRNIR